MSSIPRFDLYAALQVERTATSAEITASYRRLALIHHPDKNPDNVEAATEAFQKIQVAYEVLNNPEKRLRYDNSSMASAASSAWEDAFEPESAGDFFDFLNEILRFGTFNRQPDYAFMRGQFRQDHEDVVRQWREDQRAARERDAAERREQHRQRVEAEEAEKKAREAAKQAQLDKEQKARDDLRAAEKSKQEDRWKKLGAVTKEEQLETCLHSEHCAKTSQRQKFKCDSCKVKRGITSFECPYCASNICQQCVVTFAKRRAMPEQTLPIRNAGPAADPKPAKEPEEPKAQAEGSGHDKTPPKAKPQGGRGHPSKPQGLIRCYNCHKLGHIAKFCRNRTEGQSGYAAGDKKNGKGNQGKPRGGGKGNGQGQGQGQQTRD